MTYCSNGVTSVSQQSRRDRLLEIVSQLPEATCKGEDDIAFSVRSKRFGFYLNDHHGDGRVGVVFKGLLGDLHTLIEEDPQRFYVPAYLGSKGWVGLRLDLDSVDWTEVRELLTEAYRLQAPRCLGARLRNW
jgi:hypothetical protein